MGNIEVAQDIIHFASFWIGTIYGTIYGAKKKYWNEQVHWNQRKTIWWTTAKLFTIEKKCRRQLIEFQISHAFPSACGLCANALFGQLASVIKTRRCSQSVRKYTMFAVSFFCFVVISYRFPFGRLFFIRSFFLRRLAACNSAQTHSQLLNYRDYISLFL